MSNPDLINIFHECLERIAAGEGIEASIRDFPQYAGILRSMLETSLIVKRIGGSSAETAEAQAKMRPRIDDALQTISIQRAYVPRRIVTLVASFFILSFVIGGGLYAQSSLPGDTLYGVKLFTENVQLVVSGGGDNLRGQFAERRVMEVRELLALGRVATVTFQGVLTVRDGTGWQVASIHLQVNNGTPGAESVAVGDLIEVHGVTRNGVIAQEIRLIRAGEDSTRPIPPTPLPTVQPATPTMTPTLSQTPTVSQTPTASATMTPTFTPIVSRTPTNSATVTSSATSSATPTAWPTGILLTATPSCGVVPTGWVIYRIRSGDTLSFLSSSRGITLEAVMVVNCLTDARMIVVGQTLYLPPGAPVVETPGGNNNTPPASSSDDDDDDGDDDDDDGDDNDDDDD